MDNVGGAIINCFGAVNIARTAANKKIKQQHQYGDIYTRYAGLWRVRLARRVTDETNHYCGQGPDLYAKYTVKYAHINVHIISKICK